MPNKTRIGLLRRRAVWATGVIAALAIAAPIAEASAQPIPALPLSGFGGWPGLGGAGGYGGIGGGFGGGFGFPAAAVAIGPTVIGSAFNGGTTVVVSTLGAVGNTIASP
jgi:hypothetical protein